MSNIEAVGLGALNVDHIYQVERVLEDGEALVNESLSSPGGSAANTIYGLAKLGVRTGFIGAVGNDDEGEILRQDFEKVGVDTSRIKVKPGAKTGSVLCLSDKLGRRSLYVLSGVNNLLMMNDLDLTYINQARLLHLSSFVDDAQFELLLELINRLHPSVKISFSPGDLYASRGLGALTPILAKTYVLFINQNEIRQLTGEEFKAGAETCLKQGCHIVVVTLGKGASYKTVMATSYIKTVDDEYIVKASNQDIISDLDTIGAGDAFAAGFLYGLLGKKSLEKCGRLGNIVAQFSITKVGARQGLPTSGDLTQRYRELYNQEL